MVCCLPNTKASSTPSVHGSSAMVPFFIITSVFSVTQLLMDPMYNLIGVYVCMYICVYDNSHDKVMSF